MCGNAERGRGILGRNIEQAEKDGRIATYLDL